MSGPASGLRTAALCGLLLSAALAGGCNHAITGAWEDLPSPPPPPSQPPRSLAIVPDVIELKVGESIQLGTRGGGASSLLWASSDSAVASVSAAGMVTASRIGAATIMAGESSDCAATSARQAQVNGAPGSARRCAYATIEVLTKSGRRIPRPY